MNTSDSKSRLNLIAQTVRDIPRSGIRDFFDIVNQMEDTISLGVGEPGFPTPWHIRDVSIYAMERGATAYTSNLGMEELRLNISRYVGSFFGIDYDPRSEVIVTTGVSEGMDLVVRAITNPGDEIIYHEPSYVSYGPVIRLAHGRPVAIQTRVEDGFKLTRELLEQAVSPKTKALILNYPNNPTGAILSRGETEMVARFAVEHDLLVVSDEIYAELTYGGKHTSIASLPGMKERTLFLHGFSKAWAMTGFRMGYCCGPSELIHAMTTIHQYTMLCAPTISQIAAIEALKGAETDVAEMKSRYLLNRNLMFRSLQEMGLPCAQPLGAFYAFPRVDGLGMTSKEFALELLKEERVAVVPGEAFGPCGSGFIRCSFATSLESIKTAMERMARFVARHR